MSSRPARKYKIGICLECKAEKQIPCKGVCESCYRKQRRKNNPEKEKARNKARYARTKEKERERYHQRRDADPEAWNEAAAKRYRKRNGPTKDKVAVDKNAVKRANYAKNKPSRRAYYRDWSMKNKDKIKLYHAKSSSKETKRRYRIKSAYGISLERYDEILLSQYGACAICGSHPQEGARLVVDHDHTTGVVRGLLCRKCNLGIGHLGDSVELLLKAIQYLKQSHVVQLGDYCEHSQNGVQ